MLRPREHPADPTGLHRSFVLFGREPAWLSLAVLTNLGHEVILLLEPSAKGVDGCRANLAKCAAASPQAVGEAVVQVDGLCVPLIGGWHSRRSLLRVCSLGLVFE